MPHHETEVNGKYSELCKGAHTHAIYTRPFSFSKTLRGKKDHGQGTRLVYSLLLEYEVLFHQLELL